MKDIEQDEKVNHKYLIKIKALIQYTGDDAPDESHIFMPITRFIRKTAKAYNSKIINLEGGSAREDYVDGEEEED